MRKAATPALAVLAILGVLAGLWLFTQPADAPGSITGMRNTQDGERAEGNPLEPSNRAPEREGPTGKQPTAPEPTPRDKPKDPPNDNPENTQPQPESLVVEGIVTDIDTGAAIEGASVGLLLDDRQRLGRISTDAAGTFRFELGETGELHSSALLTVMHEGYDSLTWGQVSPGHNRLKLSRETRVIVRLGNAACVPPTAWLRWTENETAEEVGAAFDPLTGTASIRVRPRENYTGACVACVRWQEQLVESQPLHIKWRGTTEVVLTPPAGASVKVRVIGPDSLPMPGVRLVVGGPFEDGLQAVTGESGEAVFSGIPAPSRLEIRARGTADGVFCVDPLVAEIVAAGDTLALTLDLTGTGIIDCDLKAADEVLYAIGARPAGTTRGGWRHVSLRGEGRKQDARYIYGFLPGSYEVSAATWDRDQRFTGEFEVLPPPAISKWQQVFVTRSITVHVQGAPSTAGMKLYQWAPRLWLELTLAPDDSGDFVIPGLSANPIEFRICGGGYASRVIRADPDEVSEIDVTVERSGMVDLKPRDGNEANLFIHGLEPSQPYFMSEGQGSRLELPPGRYKASAAQDDGAPWEPVSFTVVAGETVGCAYGPPFTCTLRVRVKDRTELWTLNPRLLQAAETVPCRIVISSGAGDEYHEFYFSAEGKLSLQLRSLEYEDVEREFEITRGGTVTLEIDLKQKQ